MTCPDFERLSDPTPHARLLSNGRFTTLVTSAGTGGSWWQGAALTAFVPDRVEDRDGLHVFVRDLESGAATSLGFQPSGGDPAEIAAHSTPGCVALERRALGLVARLELCVLPEHDVELRRIVLRDVSGRARRIELTGCAGVVLFPAAAHAAHPAFSKLFVETERAGELLLARRRPRSRGERWPWLAAGLRGPGAFECETDRARFLGRGRSAARPRALSEPGPLSGTVGSVLDPIFALRRTLALDPGGEAVLVHALAAGEEREAALAALEHALAGDAHAPFADAERAERERRSGLGLSDDEAELLQELAGALLYGHPGLRDEQLARARGSLAELERFGVQRDLPYLLSLRESEALRRARAYWSLLDAPLGVVIEAAPSDLLRAAAGCVVDERWPEPGPAAEAPAGGAAARFRPARAEDRAAAPARRALPPRDPHLPESGFGYFSEGGAEYVLELDGARPPEATRPPMPWTNVIANERFGLLVSEGGAANSWARNSRENRLTPWSNDPIADPHGESFHLRDEAAGVFWSPQPGPTPGPAPYVVRHGLGYSVWCHESFALASELRVFVPPDAPLRVAWLELENRSREPRTLSVFSYQRLVLGGDDRAAARFVATDFDAAAGAIFATRRVGEERADEVAFAASVAEQPAELFASGDRAAFLGRGGSPGAPAALSRDAALDGRTGAGLDPCAALQLRLRLAPGERRSCAFLLGEAASVPDARAWIERYRRPGALEDAFAAMQRFWRELAGAVQIETPSPGLDVLVNGWLPYQVLACRIWGRTAFYQSGGAWGFRDQLQDAVALVLHAPALARQQLVLHAGRQFPEGDVQHWWHPPSGRGTRTRCSDDLLWLPHLTACYVRTTGDASLLGERAGFVGARELAPDEDEAFVAVERLAEQDDVYGHCCRALDRSLAVGAHGLPLIGTCDWNDGMNRVGREGRGESVWLGFFLFQTLGDFAPLCRARGDAQRAERYEAHCVRLAAALEAAWDGDWYRRAYYDDGTPLGTAAAEECRIDVLPQAWAAITGAVSKQRTEQALDAMERELVREADGMIRLLWPPFDRTPQDPGYIRGYLPGIRENGGQYTHAALWAVRGLAAAGRRERAAHLLERLTPVHHTRSAAATATYQVEPYLVAADLYGVAPHVGRGGWTGYTGSAGWMLRVALESVLGIALEGGDTLCVRPCIPDGWPGYRARLRLSDGRTQVEIAVRNASGRAAGVVGCRLDGATAGVEAGAARVRIPRDGGRHQLEIELG